MGVSTVVMRRSLPFVHTLARRCPTSCVLWLLPFSVCSSFRVPPGFVREVLNSTYHMRVPLVEALQRHNLAGSTLQPGRTPLSPRASADANRATTPATPPRRSGDTGSPSRQRLRSATICARLSATTPKRRAGKRAAVNSGARSKGSGGGRAGSAHGHGPERR